MGGSVAAAIYLPYKERFATLLERSLSASPAVSTDRVEVLNFAVAGDGSAQEAFAVEHQVQHYRPDLIVL